MKIQITCSPTFYLPLTLAHVEALRNLAIWHYDGACNRAALQGGFIYGWINWLYHSDSEDLPTCKASFGDLDLCLNIMEHTHGLSDAELALVGEMRRSFREAMKLSNKVVSPLQFQTEQ
jgi:hypothetical protein